MALQIRRVKQLPTSPNSAFALTSGLAARIRKNPGIFSTISYTTPLFTVVSLASALLAVTLLSGCTDLRYGQVDCALLQGEAARMCQEYRQRKADADIRVEQAELLQAYNYCRKKHENNPELTVKNCSIYEKPLRSIGSLPQ